MPTKEEVRQALRNVLDPEIGKPIEDVGMLKGIEVEDGLVRVYVLLTIAGCPLKDRIDTDVRAAVGPILDAGQRVEVILGESRRVVRKAPGVLIVETRHGWICANAGVDQSNVDLETACLLPEDSDRSARQLREALRRLTGHDLGIIVADTFGRPWREGLTNVAIGVAGIEPIKSYLGEKDPAGYVLQATILAVADELAAAAEPIMGKLDRIPVVIIRGLDWPRGETGSRALIRDPARDLFR